MPIGIALVLGHTIGMENKGVTQMFNLKTLALATLTTLSTLAPVEAAVTHKGITFHEASDFSGQHSIIVDQLDRAGVPVVDGRGTNLCKPGTAGWYSPDKNVMVICGGSYSYRAETLTHEAVHVAQDCRSGLSSSSLKGIQHRPHYERLVNSLHQSKVDLIATQYDESDWITEVEAFYFETRPREASWLLSDACGV